MVCVLLFYLYPEHPKARPIVVLEKRGIEPATPGLQSIALIHYTTASSWVSCVFTVL